MKFRLIVGIVVLYLKIQSTYR